MIFNLQTLVLFTSIDFSLKVIKWSSCFTHYYPFLYVLKIVPVCYFYHQGYLSASTEVL